MRRWMLGAVAAFLLLGCNRHASPPIQGHLTLAVSPNHNVSLVHLAGAQGSFAKEGLAVTLSSQPFGKVALDMVLQGKADLATCADTPFVMAVLKEEDLVVVGTLATTTRDARVYARRDAGIRTAKDLRGKRVGVTCGTIGEYHLDTLLLRHRLPYEAITRVELRPAEMLEALATRQVDAVSTFGISCLRVEERLGDQVAMFMADDLFLEAMVLVGRREWVAAHQSEVVAVLRALKQAERFMRDHPGEARQELAARLGMALADLERTWADYDFRLQLDQRLVVLLAEEARWVISTGHVAQREVPDFSNQLDARPLMAVDPRAIELMR